MQYTLVAIFYIAFKVGQSVGMPHAMAMLLVVQVAGHFTGAHAAHGMKRSGSVACTAMPAQGLQVALKTVTS